MKETKLKINSQLNTFFCKDDNESPLRVRAHARPRTSKGLKCSRANVGYAVLQKPGFARKLSYPSLAEVTGLFGDFASTCLRSFYEKGVPYIAKKEISPQGVMLLKHYGILQHKTEKLTSLRKTRPAAENIVAELLDQFCTKV